jgi:hypothetical protein
VYPGAEHSEPLLHPRRDSEGIVGLGHFWRIVRRNGGRICTKAKVGEGATFYLTLGEGLKSTRTNVHPTRTISLPEGKDSGQLAFACNYSADHTPMHTVHKRSRFNPSGTGGGGILIGLASTLVAATDANNRAVNAKLSKRFIVLLSRIARFTPKCASLNTVRKQRRARRSLQAWFDARWPLLETLQAVIASTLWPTWSSEVGLAASASPFAITDLNTNALGLVPLCDSVPLWEPARFSLELRPKQGRQVQRRS